MGPNRDGWALRKWLVCSEEPVEGDLPQEQEGGVD